MAFSFYLTNANVSNSFASNLFSKTYEESYGPTSQSWFSTSSEIISPQRTSQELCYSSDWAGNFRSVESGKRIVSIYTASDGYTTEVLDTRSTATTDFFGTSIVESGEVINLISGRSEYNLFTTPVSYFPYVDIAYSYRFTYTEDYYGSTTSETNSGASIGVPPGNGNLTLNVPSTVPDFISLKNSFTYTTTYSVYKKASTTLESVISGATQSYESLTKVLDSSTGTFTSVRLKDFVLGFVPINISYSYAVKHFRDVAANSDTEIYTFPLLIGFSGEKPSGCLISNYDFLLNQTNSSSFSIQNSFINIGSYTPPSSGTTITYTANNISLIPESTTVTSYYGYTYSNGYGFLSYSTTFSHTIKSVSTTSTTHTYSFDAGGNAELVESYQDEYGRYWRSGYAPCTITISRPTTYSYIDFYAPNFSGFPVSIVNTKETISYIRTITALTTRSAVTAINSYVQSDSSSYTDGGTAIYFKYEEYPYPKMLEVLLYPYLTFSNTGRTVYCQTSLIGNFINTVSFSEATGFWNITGGSNWAIYKSSFLIKRGAPPFYSYGNYSLELPFDPLSTSIFSVTLTQNASTANSDEVSISQSVFWYVTSLSSTSSTSRTTLLKYSGSNEAMHGGQNTINDIDTINQSPTPEVTIDALNIFNKIGEFGGTASENSSASYIADGHYFKHPTISSIFYFLSQNEMVSYAVSLEKGYYDNAYSSFTLVKNPTIFAGLGGDVAFLSAKSMIQQN